MIKLTGKSSDFVNFGLATAKQGNLLDVEQLLKVRPEWLNQVGPHGRTMLWEAAYRVSAYVAAMWKQRTETAELIYELYQPLDIFSAAFLGNRASVKQLIDEEPDLVNQERSQHDREAGFTCLHYAISGGYCKVLKLLLERGANPHSNAHWLVKFAIWRSDLENVRLLLDTGIFPDQLKWEPAFARSPKLRVLLQRYGIQIDPNAAESGWPPIVYESRGDRGGNIGYVT